MAGPWSPDPSRPCASTSATSRSTATILHAGFSRNVFLRLSLLRFRLSVKPRPSSRASSRPRQRSRRMGSASSAAGAGGGVDWTVPRRLLKSVRTKTTRYAYRAVFQGSILHNGNGGKDVCKFCGDSGTTLRHLMYEVPFLPWWHADRGTFWRRSAGSQRTACGFGVCFPLNTSQSLPWGT